MRDLNVALIQTYLDWHSPAANRQRFTDKISTIHSADLIVLPEMFTTGFTMDAEGQAEAADSTSLNWMQQMATESKAVITGSISVDTGSGYVNRLYWVRPDHSFDYYDKHHLFTMADEHHAYTPGQKRLIVELNGWKVCPFICYDLRFPIWSRNLGDYDLLLYVANWPNKRRQHWIKLLQARAIENQSWCVGVNRIGSDGNSLTYAGDSLICDPLGEPLNNTEDKDQVIQQTLSAEQLLQIRSQLPFMKDADRFELTNQQ